MLFQWRRAGSTKFRLTFQGPYSTITIYTDGSHPDCADSDGAACWQADVTTWQAIAGSNAGASTQLTIDGLGHLSATGHAVTATIVAEALGAAGREPRRVSLNGTPSLPPR